MPPHPHCHWRGTKDWLDFGLEMSTTSDEAAKLFDAALTQAVNHFDDESVGGLEGCLKKMKETDPEFVLGHALRLGLVGSHVNKDVKYAQEIYKMAELAQKEHVKPWERQHAHAVQLFAEGKIDAASDQWEEILIEHPRDMMSLRFLHDMYIYNGQSKRLRDSLGRVVSQWTPSTPFYGDFLGMYAFGLEETNFYTEAEATARKALEVNRYDAWAAHAISHCKEMTGGFEDGIKFMGETENTWSDNGLGCHNYWHWALYYVEKGEFETALGILDSQVFPRMKKSRTNFSVTDAAALMFRLQAEGVDLGNRWDDVLDVAQPHMRDHIWSFTDLNVFMTLLGAKRHDLANQMLNSLRDYSKNGTGDIQNVYDDVTVPVMEAVQAYDSGDFDKTVDIMKPLRYEVQRVGGSHAQRDVFHLLTIHAAIKSKRPENHRYANHLLQERKSYKGDTPLINRLTEKLILCH